jgi:hypothetical protein
MSDSGDQFKDTTTGIDEAETQTSQQFTDQTDDFPRDATKYSQDFRKLFCDGHVKDEFLFQDFWEYFGNWTLADFRKIRKEERVYLRDNLRHYGVYVERNRGLEAANALAEAIRATENTWPADQIEMQARMYPGSVTNRIQIVYLQTRLPHQNQPKTVF